jgi:photosystem II stability/assembly factor-like uncharacterized protein/PKD repeat protein
VKRIIATKCTGVLLFFILGLQYISAQEWLHLFLKEEATFFEIENAYNEHFSIHNKERGTGYKHFERWAYYAKQDLTAEGRLPSVEEKLSAFHQFKDHTAKIPSDYRSQNEWVNFGPDNWINQTGWNPGIGRVNEIAVDPNNDSIVYAGTPQGGLWKTYDLGKNWIPLTDHLPSLGVSGIAIHPTNTATIYIATGDAYASDSYATGVYKSINGGESFELAGLEWDFKTLRRMRKMDIHPNTPDTLLVATSMGIFKTTDGGKNWESKIGGNFYDVKYKYGDPDVVFAISQTNFFLSSDGGETFRVIGEGYSSSNVRRIAMAITPANPAVVYLLAAANDDNGFRAFYKSVDSGESFQLMSQRDATNNILGYSLDGTGSGGQGWYDLALAASPVDENLVFTGGVHIWYTADGGSTFKNLTNWYYPSSLNYVHADIHYLGFWNQRLYCGNDGGVFFTDNNGFNWSDISEGLSINQIYRFSTSPILPSLMGAGSQDNGCNFFINGRWRHLNGGDGMEVGIDPENPNILYVASQYGGLRRSLNGGQDFSGIKPPNESGAWVTPYKISASSPNILYAGYDNLWKTEDRGNQWIKTTNFAEGGQKITQLAVYEKDHKYVYFSRGSSLFKTSDGGNTISQLNTANTGSGVITYIAIDPENPQGVYITFGGYSEGKKLFYSRDGGQSFIDITRNLPGIPVRCITTVKGPDSPLYIGTQFGVFYTDSTLLDWVPYNQGLPTSQVNEIEINYALEKIRIATYGRGIWETDLIKDLSILPQARYTLSEDVVCRGESIEFTSNSLFNVGNVIWEFEGGSPATSTENNPRVKYSKSGVFSVKLIAYNNLGADTLLHNQRIVVLNNMGLSTPVSENFDQVTDDGLGAFFVSNTSPFWKISDLAAFSGNQALVFESLNVQDYSQSNEISSYVFDLSNLNHPILSFRYAQAMKRRIPDVGTRLWVYASYDCGESWQSIALFSNNSLRNEVFTEDYYLPLEEAEWRTSIIPLKNDSESFSDNVRIKFVYTSTAVSNNLWIDMVNIEEMEPNTSITQHLSTTECKVFPNPAKDIVSIELIKKQSSETLIQLFDNKGNLTTPLANQWLGTGSHYFTLNGEKLARGLYYLLVKEGENSTIKKIIFQ